MKKTYKRMPRNLALTNKIINGLIEGKIVSDENGIVYIELPEEATNHSHYYDMVKDEITDDDRKAAEEIYPDSLNMQSAFITGLAYQILKQKSTEQPQMPKKQV